MSDPERPFPDVPPAEEPIQVERLLDHEYDGIHEYDNPTPGWWNAIFWATFAFSVLYFLFFHFSPVAWSIWDRYDDAVAADLRRQFGEIGDLEPDQPTMLRFMQEERWLVVGRKVFEGNCVSCHGSDGSGLVGPNLTDHHYKNVRELDDIAAVIAEGAANGAMPAWQNRLHPNEIVLTACYVANMRGKDLPSERPPEGEVLPPWPEPLDAPGGAEASREPPARKSEGSDGR